MLFWRKYGYKCHSKHIPNNIHLLWLLGAAAWSVPTFQVKNSSCSQKINWCILKCVSSVMVCLIRQSLYLQSLSGHLGSLHLMSSAQKGQCLGCWGPVTPCTVLWTLRVRETGLKRKVSCYYHRITKWVGLDGTSAVHPAQPPSQGRLTSSRWHRTHPGGFECLQRGRLHDLPVPVLCHPLHKEVLSVSINITIFLHESSL